MTDDNFRLARYEELLDHLEELSETDNPDLAEVAVTGLRAMINDQLAFIRNQLDTGVLPPERAQEGMQFLESPFVYGYLVGAGSYVGAVVGEEYGGTASIDAMRYAFGEMYMDNGERNWKASQAVPEDDSEFETGFEKGGEDLSRFLSRLQGKDLGPPEALAEFIHDRLMSTEGAPVSPGDGSTGVSQEGGAADDEAGSPDDDAEIQELLETMNNPGHIAGLETDELGRLIHRSNLLFGNNGDPRLQKILDVLYPAFCEKEDESSRLHEFYRAVADAVEQGTTGHESLKVFLLHDDSPALVSTAALDFSVYHSLQDGDPMTGPKAVLEMFNENGVECRAGLFKGLMLLGDDRVFDLLREARRRLSPQEAHSVCGPGSGFLFASTINFLIDWLEEAEEDEDEGTYGLVAAALGNMPRTATAPLVFAGRRRFPVEPDGEILENGFKKVPLDDFAETIEPRLRAIADREPPPQVMPLVLGAWGLEP